MEKYKKRVKICKNIKNLKIHPSGKDFKKWAMGQVTPLHTTSQRCDLTF